MHNNYKYCTDLTKLCTRIQGKWTVSWYTTLCVVHAVLVTRAYNNIQGYTRIYKNIQGYTEYDNNHMQRHTCTFLTPSNVTEVDEWSGANYVGVPGRHFQYKVFFFAARAQDSIITYKHRTAYKHKHRTAYKHKHRTIYSHISTSIGQHTSTSTGQHTSTGQLTSTSTGQHNHIQAQAQTHTYVA